jgi:hypothetical protein
MTAMNVAQVLSRAVLAGDGACESKRAASRQQHAAHLPESLLSNKI